MDRNPESFLVAGEGVRPGWRVVLVGTIGQALGPSALQFMTLGTFAPYLKAEFGWDVSAIALAGTILALMATVASLAQGLMVDRFGARRMILVCVPLYGLGYAALSMMSGSLWQFQLLWAVLPLLGIGLWPASWVKAASSWFDQRLGFAIGVSTAGIGIGAMALPLIIHFIAQSFGWRAAFAIVGVGAVVLVWPLAFLFVRERIVQVSARIQEGQETQVEEEPEKGEGRKSTLPLLLFAFILLGMYSVAILVNLVSILQANGMSLTQAVAAQSSLGLAMIVGRILSGLLLDRVSVRIVFPALAAIAAFSLICLSFGASGAVVYPCAIGAGLLIGAEIDVLGFLIKRYFGLGRYASLYGVLFGTFQLGGGIGAFAVGALRAADGDYNRALLASALVCITSGLLFLFLGPYRYEPGKPAEATR